MSESATDNSSKLKTMERSATWTPDGESERKRAEFRNLIQLIRLTSTILSKGKGPKFPETAPKAYAAGPYTYLDASARLLVRKDEIIAAAECGSICNDSDKATFGVALMAQQPGPLDVPVISQPGYADHKVTSDDVWDDNPPLSADGGLPATYITNPDFSFNDNRLSDNKPQILYQSSQRPQETMWDKIKENEWYYLMLPPRPAGNKKNVNKMAPRVNLSRHLATIESYLEEYRALHFDESTEARFNNRDKFLSYILTSCWMKMFARAEHWISIRIITSICKISDISVSEEVRDDPEDAPIQVDQDLMGFLKGGHSTYIAEIMGYHFEYMGGLSNDTKYGKDLDPILYADIRDDRKLGKVYKYTPAIAVAFHRLLVSSLLSYVFRLRIVNKAVKAYNPNSKQPPSPVILAFNQLLLSVRLLFWISHSKLLKKHLKSLDAHLSIPAEADMEKYSRKFKGYAKQHEKHEDDKVLMESFEVLNPTPESNQASTVKDSDAEGPRTTDGSDENFGTTDEALVLQDQEKEVYNFYRRWIMGFVDHFTSIRVLEQVSRKLPRDGKINFSILGLNRQALKCSTWKVMQDEIQTLCQDSSLVSEALGSEKTLHPDTAISFMEENIKAYEFPKFTTEVKKTSEYFEEKVYRFFKILLSSETSDKCAFLGSGHCEAILMAIIHRILIKNDQDFSLSILPHSRKIQMAITKSCCPVCWKILTSFNRRNENTEGSKSEMDTFPVSFVARGRHPNLYPVDLPDILDESIKDELLKDFRIVLLRNLASLEEEAKAPKGPSKHTRSESDVSQAESVALSIASTFVSSDDYGTAQARQATVSRDRTDVKKWVELWRIQNSGPEPSN